MIRLTGNHLGRNGYVSSTKTGGRKATESGHWLRHFHHYDSVYGAIRVRSGVPGLGLDKRGPSDDA